MKKFLCIVIATLAIAATASAQGSNSKFSNEMYKAKHELIINECGLTQTQQKSFMPLYEQMEQEIFKLNRDARGIAAEVEKKKNPSDSDYEKAAQALSSIRVKEGEIEARYFKKFATILSKKQLYQLKQAEAKFTKQMISNRKNSQDRK